ncbi:hypothetical protein pb186bvf_008152 [Paramecium bursaria]
MQLNNLNYCEYQLKNGLPYFGLKATNYLPSNCEIVKIPFDLLITCSVAYKSELQNIFDQNPRYFLNNSQIECQRRILIIFLLFQFQIGSQSKWYHYIKNLPKDVETFSFWPEQEQQLLNDRFLLEQATREKYTFYQEFEIFKEITNKYNEVFDQELITIENFQSLYMILQTRIFGNTLPDLTLIPFCDLFNHECVNVYYELNYQEKENGKAISRAIQYRDQQFQEQQEYGSDSSTDGSYDSLDQQDEDQFSQEDFRGFLLKLEYDSHQVQFHETFEEKYNQTQETNDNATISYIGMSDSYDYQICPIGTQWKTLKDVYKIIQKLNDQVFTSKLEETIALFISGQFNFVIDECISQYMFNQIDSTELGYRINQIINEFISQRSQLESLQSSFKHQVLEYQTPQRQNFKVVEDQDSKIKYFVMSTSHKDKFEMNSQVYFCYGRLSNRQLLLRYGFCLEYNKYDHVYINLNYLAYANCRHTIYLAHQKRVKKTKLITLRQTRFPTEFVQFCKALTFQYKIHNTTSIFVFDQYCQEHYAMLLAIEIIQDHIDKYLNFDEIQFAQQLTDPNLNYHQYFSNIYRLEQQRICTQNINLLKMALMMIEDLKGCKEFDIDSTKYDQSIPTHFIQPYKYMIANYFKLCQFVL